MGMRLFVVGATGSLGRGQPRVLRSGDKGRLGQVSRQGLARVLIDAAERPDYVHQAIVVGS